MGDRHNGGAKERRHDSLYTHEIQYMPASNFGTG